MEKEIRVLVAEAVKLLGDEARQEGVQDWIEAQAPELMFTKLNWTDSRLTLSNPAKYQYTHFLQIKSKGKWFTVSEYDHFEEISFILRLLSKEISNFKKNQAFREQKKEEAVSDIKLLVNGLKQKRG